MSYSSYSSRQSGCCNSTGHQGPQGDQGPQGVRGIDSAGTLRFKFAGVGDNPPISSFMTDNSSNSLVTSVYIQILDEYEVNGSGWISTWGDPNHGFGTLQIYKEVDSQEPVVNIIMEIKSVTFFDALTNDLKYYKVSGIVHTSDYRPLLLDNFYALNYTATGIQGTTGSQGAQAHLPQVPRNTAVPPVGNA